MQLTLTPCPRKGRQPVERSATFEPSLPGQGLLTITTGDETTAYNLFEIGSEIGGRGFQLDKLDGEGETYHVHVSADPVTTHCDCLSGEHRGTCKHLDAIRTLIQLDGLPAAGLTSPCQSCYLREAEASARLCIPCQIEISADVAALAYHGRYLVEPRPSDRQHAA